LSYLRDRLLLSRELLNSTGSVFVQISDENVHHVREIMDDIFGSENFCALITFVKTAAQSAELLPSVSDYLLWYARDKDRLKYRQLYRDKTELATLRDAYSWLLMPDNTYRKATTGEIEGTIDLPKGAKLYRLSPLTSQRPPGYFPFEYQGKTYLPGKQYWKTHKEGLQKLAQANRLQPSGQTLFYRLFLDDFPAVIYNNVWTDTQASFADKVYVVQTNTKVVERCMMMTTDPGDLVLDPTCGSGTTAYMAEEWGRRWITVDTSRVPLALARQRLLTATFPWYALKDEKRGPVGGFIYQRKQNKKGEEVGGIVPHITLKSIANNEPPQEEILVDRPEELKGITRITGPFRVEATIPRPLDWEESENGQVGDAAVSAAGSYVDRMIEVLRRSPVLHVGGNKTVTFKNVRPPAKSLALSAEALLGNGNGQGESKPVAFVFGPENGAVSERLVTEAIKEAYMKSYQHLYVIGFAIQPNARMTIENAEALGVPATYVQATLDLQMGDLLKHMRSSQIFSVAGLPEIAVKKAESDRYQVELLGLDVFDPVTMEVDHRRGDDVPAWFLDTDYNGLCFYVHQAFFPRTSAWDNLKRALKGNFHEDVWEHLAGTTSEPFAAGENRQIAVKVIDDRGNELLVVKPLP
jgi:adenine-specific DNA-methyltransferase